jgi:hypothetical protein
MLDLLREPIVIMAKITIVASEQTANGKHQICAFIPVNVHN